MLRPPRLLLYNDGRHANSYGYEPPMGVRQFREPVDELVDSGVDTLLFCVGDTRVLLYDTRVGERWGHNLTDWSHAIWYRSKVNLEMARAAGIDPLRVVCERANEKGIRILPTLLLATQAWEDRATTFHGRCSDFCFDHPEYCIDFAGGDYRFNYNLPQVRAERFAVIEELLMRYPADGIELSFYTLKPLCKAEEVDELRTTLTAWMRDVRAVAQQAATMQRREKTIAVRVPAVWEGCHAMGLDLPRWLEEGIVDWLIPHTADPAEQIDQDMPLQPFAQAAHAHGRKVFAAIAPLIQNDWYAAATKEMFHAAAANAYAQGVDGVTLIDFFPTAYPWSDGDYGILRQIGHPDLLERKDKRFRARSQTGRVFSQEEAPLGYRRPLPVTLTLGERGPDVPIHVSDDLATAAAEGCLDSVTLTTRVTNVCPEDGLRFFFNGEELPLAWARLDDYTYKLGYVRLNTRIGAHYWFDFALPPSYYPRQGHNVLRVDLVQRASALAKFMSVTVHDAEITVRYRPHRNAPKQFQRFADAR
jgi:hypothetical protein